MSHSTRRSSAPASLHSFQFTLTMLFVGSVGIALLPHHALMIAAAMAVLSLVPVVFFSKAPVIGAVVVPAISAAAFSYIPGGVVEMSQWFATPSVAHFLATAGWLLFAVAICYIGYRNDQLATRLFSQALRAARSQLKSFD